MPRVAQIEMRARFKVTKRRTAIIEKWKRLGRPDIVDNKIRMFTLQDKQKDTKLRVFEYVCTYCNRPFTVPRKRHQNWIARCRPCAEFVARKKVRDRQRETPRKKKQPQQQPAPMLQQVPTLRREPVVVWQPEDVA